MDLKTNVNKLHLDLMNNFQDVSINEKSDKLNGNYIELSVNENGRNLVAIIPKTNLENNKFNWKYYSNPISKDFLVERGSTTESFLHDVKDIFDKKRFDSDYIKATTIIN